MKAPYGSMNGEAACPSKEGLLWNLARLPIGSMMLLAFSTVVAILLNFGWQRRMPWQPSFYHDTTLCHNVIT